VNCGGLAESFHHLERFDSISDPRSDQFRFVNSGRVCWADTEVRQQLHGSRKDNRTISLVLLGHKNNILL
jgi:hypothetical protein